VKYISYPLYTAYTLETIL